MSPLLQQLAQVEKLAKSTRFYRMFRHPLKYTFAICFNYGIYPIFKKGFKLQTRTFFGVPITVSLPAGTDIFLTGGKSHSSEIRLAKFLILSLKPGDSFVDVGAHFGYFSLLAARLVGTSGQVIALEASKKTFDILEQNTRTFGQIKSNHLAAAAQQGQLEFYEFPDLYSEYNSTEITQFEQESWIAKYKPEKIVVPALPIDSLIESARLTPNIIKIDVEGAEFHVLQGMQTFLASDNSCSIVMEYLSAERGNEAHQKARDFMRSLGYETFVFGPEGHLVPVADIDQHLTEASSDSDNVIFKKLR